MKKTSEPIAFFGSGPVANKSLRYLNENFNISLVITKTVNKNLPDNESVIKTSEKLNIPYLTANNKLELSSTLNRDNLPRIGVLVDYGVILTIDDINRFSLGIMNSHFSLLPQWRGADPITFSILSGQSETGVSLMLINEKLDEGLLLGQSKIDISDGYNSIQLTDKLINLSNELFGNVLPKYLKDEIKPYPQDVSKSPTYSRKLVKDDGKIDWGKPAEAIEREVRAFVTWPKSHTSLGNTKVIVTAAHVTEYSGIPGKIDKNFKDRIVVFCGKKSIEIDRLKPLGKNEMSSKSFLSGYKI